MRPPPVYRVRSIGQAPSVPPSPPWAERTVSGISYRLLTEPARARLLSAENPGVGGPPVAAIVYAGEGVVPSHAHVTGPGGTMRSADWLKARLSAGDGVIATKITPQTPLTVGGQPLAPGLEVAIATRDLAFVGSVSAADPKALVLFEPKNGWAGAPHLGRIYAVVAIGVLAIGAALYLTHRS